MSEIIKQELMTGKELRKLRVKFGYSLRDFGAKVGLSHQAVSNYEKGKRMISSQTEKQINGALGLSYDKKHDYDLNVHLDYLKLTFFGSTVDVIMNRVLGLEKEDFIYQVNKRNNYDGIYLSGHIQIYVSENIHQGILLELSGQALMELEILLQETEENLTLNEWLVTITDPLFYEAEHIFSRFNCTRLDIAIDEMYKENGKNYDLHDLKWRKEYKDGILIETSLRSSQDIESYWNDQPLGLTLYFGSPNGNFLLRMYEKAKERAKKENRELDEVLNDYGVVNRYEMQIKEQYAEKVFDDLARGITLDQFAINLLLSKISVFEEVKTESGKIAFQYYQPFYDVFGEWNKVKINGKNNETDFERSMNWIVSQVSGTLALFKAVFGKQWLLDWLEKIIEDRENEGFLEADKNQKIIKFEKARLKVNKNLSYLFYRKQLLDKKYQPLYQSLTVESKEKTDDEKLFIIRVNIPVKMLVYIDKQGEFSFDEPKGLSMKEILVLGEKKGVDFTNSSFFVVYEKKERYLK